MNGDDWLAVAVLALMVGVLCVAPQLWIFRSERRRDEP